MIHAGPDDDGTSEINDGFVSIAKAERMRRAETTRSFRAKHDAVYVDAVRASAALKVALQKFEESKAAIVSAANGLPVGDILDAIHLDSLAAVASQGLSGLSALTFKQAEMAAKKATKAA